MSDTLSAYAKFSRIMVKSVFLSNDGLRKRSGTTLINPSLDVLRILLLRDGGSFGAKLTISSNDCVGQTIDKLVSSILEIFMEKLPV